jgi:hypothetical protein
MQNRRSVISVKNRISFFGHRVSANGLKVDPEKVELWLMEISSKRCPWSSFSSWSGVNYFQKSLWGYSKMVFLLTNLKRRTNPGNGPKNVKRHLRRLSTPRLTHESKRPQSLGNLLVSNASGVGLGADLLPDGRPVAFESRKLLPAGQNYIVTKQKMLGVIVFLGSPQNMFCPSVTAVW